MESPAPDFAHPPFRLCHAPLQAALCGQWQKVSRGIQMDHPLLDICSLHSMCVIEDLFFLLFFWTEFSHSPYLWSASCV